jgi:hypothetical protein
MIIKRIVTVDPAALAPTALATAESVVVANLSPLNLRQSIYVGDRGVTKDTGFEIPYQKSYSFDLEVNKPLYAVADSAQGTADIDCMVLETLPKDTNAVPMNINLAADLGGEVVIIHQAIQAATVNDLPSQPAKGLMADMVIGTWPDIEAVNLICFEDPVTHSKVWRSESQPLITMMDQGYMGSSSVGTPDYIDTPTTVGSNLPIGWTTRAIRRTSEILATGLKPETDMRGIIGGTSAGATFTVFPFWFQHNNADQVVFSNDGSTRDGESRSQVSGADNLVRFFSTGWNDIFQKNTTLQLTASYIQKSNLWPRLYGQMSAGASQGQLIDVDLVYRWYVPAS